MCISDTYNCIAFSPPPPLGPEDLQPYIDAKQETGQCHANVEGTSGCTDANLVGEATGMTVEECTAAGGVKFVSFGNENNVCDQLVNCFPTSQCSGAPVYVITLEACRAFNPEGGAYQQRQGMLCNGSQCNDHQIYAHVF